MTKRRSTPGTGQLNLEIELELLERVRGFAAERREKIRNIVEMALRRHLANPPPIVEVPPLPPVTVVANTGGQASFDGPPNPTRKGKAKK